VSVSRVMAPVSTRSRANCENTYHPGCRGCPYINVHKHGPSHSSPPQKWVPSRAISPTALGASCGGSGAPAGAAPPASTGPPYGCGDTSCVRGHLMSMGLPHAFGDTLYKQTHPMPLSGPRGRR
jgi:hypothetical protein